MAEANTLVSVKDEGDKVRLEILSDKTEFLKQYGDVLDYQIKDRVREKVVPILVEDVLKNKDEIVKQVLKEVNWPEIVRSEIAQKLIKAIAQGTLRDY